VSVKDANEKVDDLIVYRGIIINTGVRDARIGNNNGLLRRQTGNMISFRTGIHLDNVKDPARGYA
jgi:hypothetical protein